MPVYRVQGPDGKVYRVEGPEGATADQLGSFILSQNIGETRPPVDQSVTDPKDASAVRAPKQTEPTGIQKFWTSMPGRFVQGGMDVVDAGAQMLSRLGGEGEAARVDAMVKERNKLYEDAKKATGFDGADIARPLGSAALQMLALRGFNPTPATMLGKVGMGAVQGGAFGALQPVTEGDSFAAEKAKQVGLGAATGAVATPIVEGAARIINPAARAAVEPLKKEGVRLTPGQILGGVFKTAEEKAQSIPIVGPSITAAKERGIQDVNRIPFNRALSAVDESLPKGVVGNDAVAQTKQVLRGKYDKVLSEVGNLGIDDQLVRDFDTVGQSLRNIPKQKRDQFIEILKNEVGDRFKGGSINGESIKAAESNLLSQAKGYQRSQDYDTRQLGKALEDSVDALRGLVQRQAPEQAVELAKANKGWAYFKRGERAASYVGAENGVFTPAQLHNAVRAMDRSKDKSAFAAGQALLQDVSAPAKSMMTDTVRNSGTADRAMAAGLAASLINKPFSTLMTLPLTIPPMMAYSRPGVAVAEALLTSRPQVAQPLAEILRRNSVALTAPAYPAVNGLLYGTE